MAVHCGPLHVGTFAFFAALTPGRHITENAHEALSPAMGTGAQDDRNPNQYYAELLNKSFLLYRNCIN